MPWGTPPSSQPGNLIELRGADEVVLGQPADGVRAVANPADVVAHLEVRVMIFNVGDMRHGIDETHGAIEITETEFTTQAAGLLIEGPRGITTPHQRIGRAPRQGRRASFARYAAPLCQLSHGAPSRCLVRLELTDHILRDQY